MLKSNGVKRRSVVGVSSAIVASAIVFGLLCFWLVKSIFDSPYHIVAGCRSPDGKYECVILEKPPPGLLQQSPYEQRMEIRDANGNPLPGICPTGSTDSTVLPDPKVTWAGDSFVASWSSASTRAFVHNEMQLWPGYVDSDATLRDLDGLSQVREVNAIGPGVTDEGLMHLATCPNLTILWLNGTRGTEEGVRRLREKLPNLQIKYPFGALHPITRATP